jgi:hypothetical protein
MNIKEFRELGYLQEINRTFLHPLGLALEIVQNEDGSEVLGGIWDYREDEEGIYFDIENSDIERQRSFNKKKNFIDSEFDIRLNKRYNKLGFKIEPIFDPDVVDGDYKIVGDVITDDNLKSLNNKINDGRLFGELGHTDSMDFNLSKVSHRITNIKKENGEYLANISFLNTKKGGDAFELLNSGECELKPRMVGDIIVSIDICRKFNTNNEE